MGWADWQYGRKGVDTDYFDRATCQYDAPSTKMGNNTCTGTVHESTAHETRTATTTDTDDEIDLQVSNDEVGTSISISYENAIPSTITQRAATATNITQISTNDITGESSDQGALEGEARTLQTTTESADSTVPWAIIGSVLGSIGVALGIMLTLCKICKKKPSRDGGSTYYDTEFDEHDDMGAVQILNITQ
jgi:hypothetical protein